MIESKECAKIKPHIKGQYIRIENSVSVGFPDIVLCLDSKIRLIEAKVVHGVREPYFWLEKSQKIWHLHHKRANCSALFILFHKNEIHFIEGIHIPEADMTWSPSKGKWKVEIEQFFYITRSFDRVSKNWADLNALLWG